MIPASVGFQCPECVRGAAAAPAAPRRTRASGWRGTTGRFGPVTLALVALNVVMFVATAVSAVGTGHSPLDNVDSPLFGRLDQVPVLVDGGQWWRVLTAAFLHIGLLHLAVNMMSLLVMGGALERPLGSWRFAGVYVVSLLGGAAALQLFSAPGAAAAGASTAIFGLLGALAVLLLVNRQDLRQLLTVLALNLLLSLLPGISLVGHVGGLVAGALATAVLVLGRRLRAVQVGGLVALGALLLAVALVLPAGSGLGAF